MAQLNSVKVVEVCRVTPHQGSPDSATPEDHYSLPLTFFDLLWLRFSHIQRIFFFETSSSVVSILPKLKTSLSHTLQHFLPLAGNLTWPQHSTTPILSYAKGDAVSLTVAEFSNAEDFHLLSGSDFVEADKYHLLVPRQLEASAAIALQITVFPNRGFSVGTVMHHAVMDGKTYISFVKSWAYICKQIAGSSCNVSILPDELKPFYDRTVIPDPAGVGELYSKHYLHEHGPNNRSLTPALHFGGDVKPDSIRGTFELTRTKIQTLREHVTSTMASDSSSLHLSTFSLTCAYCWVCSVKAQEIKGGKTALILAVDARARLDPPIPAPYFGNCIVGRVAVAETKGLLGEDGLLVALSAITDALKSLDQKGILNGAESWISNFIDISLFDRVFSVAGSPRFEVYDIDFGWGRPKRTAVVSIDRTGAISLSDSKNGGGAVEVGLVMKKEYMEAFVSLFAEGNEVL